MPDVIVQGADDAGHYLLATYRYIELNPVAAGMVRRPEDYPWSSYGANALGAPDELVVPHAEYLALASSRERVIDNYRALMSQALTSDDIGAISTTLKANYPLGNDRFRQSIEQALGKRIGRLKVGRGPGS